MKILDWRVLNEIERARALMRPRMTENDALVTSVRRILDEVKRRGDQALREFTSEFDHTEIKDFRVEESSIKKARSSIDPTLAKAMDVAQRNIKLFHEAERPREINIETMPGVSCSLHWRAVGTVGIYIPGGTAPLFSTVLMQGIPAKIAGCPRIFLCTPMRDGKMSDAILAAADLCGITEVYAVGGAHAVAAMAYGTETIPKVDKIFGPGNAYVTKAKQLVSQDVDGAAIDMPAGPSEVMILAFESDHASWIAADMLAQAEHDITAQSIFVTTSTNLAKAVIEEIERQIAELPRKSVAEQSIAEGRVIVVPDQSTAFEVANRYAPEHLIIHDENADEYLPLIENAGSVFLGPYTPEAAGDYASGTNHVLPTNGAARAYSGISVLSFMKSMTVQKISSHGLRNLGPTIVTMANAEGLDAHAAAIQIRQGEA